jgi:hypothetical protein
LHGNEFWFDAADKESAFLHGDFRDGLYPDLPWFIEDQRPQGFLGRAFARRVADDIGAARDLQLWRCDDVVLALLRHGSDEPGDLVVGDRSLQHALDEAMAPADAIDSSTRDRRFPELAEAVLRGDPIGSSAGGEQPKFAVVLRNGDSHAPVIVKFSDHLETPGGRRWADLLVCEHLASVLLRENGLLAARNELHEAGGRMFLQSDRFDRTPCLGRCGFVSLFALDAAYYGHGRIDWWRFAPQLHRDGWIDAESARRLRLYGWFGALIANEDMHLGNAALHLATTRPFTLAPAFDMLPMRFRPASSGEVIALDYKVVLPTPEQRTDWEEAAGLALDFWERASTDQRISSDFRGLCELAHKKLTLARKRS